MATQQKTEEKKDNGSRTLQQGQQGGEQPSRELERSRREGRDTALGFLSPFSLMRRMFEDFAGSFMGLEMPRVDVEKRDNDILVQADLPGMAPEDLRVTIDENMLILEGERRDERENRRENMYTSERTYGRFRRVIPLPADIDPSKARASFQDGVLEIEVPMLEERRQRGRNIEVQRGKGTRH